MIHMSISKRVYFKAKDKKNCAHRYTLLEPKIKTKSIIKYLLTLVNWENNKC